MEVINNLRYADGTTIIAEDPNDLELPVNKVKHANAEVDLELNVAKTKSQIFKINGQDLEIEECCKCYIFLGSIVIKDGMCIKEIKRRIMMGKSGMSKLE